MTNKEIKEYMNLCIIGKESIPKRKKILDKKLLELENEISKLQESINFINYKKQFYDDVLSGKTTYFSYLKNN